MALKPKKCPKCGLINPGEAERCDCGFTFGACSECAMGNRERPWRPDRNKILASKSSFLQDCRNLRQSVWARERLIIADFSVYRLFTKFCEEYPKPDDSEDFEALRSEATHFSIEEIAELVQRSRDYIWLTSSYASVPARLRQDILGALDFIAFAGGSLFNAGYSGIHLFCILPNCQNFDRHRIAVFYGGRVYENKPRIKRLRTRSVII